MLGSKSAASIRERLRLAKKKGEQLATTGMATSTPPLATPRRRKRAPAGGVDKESPTKLNNTPRKAKSAKSEVKAEDEEMAEEIEEELAI
jgi:hypothetical protein